MTKCLIILPLYLLLGLSGAQASTCTAKVINAHLASAKTIAKYTKEVRALVKGHKANFSKMSAIKNPKQSTLDDLFVLFKDFQSAERVYKTLIKQCNKERQQWSGLSTTCHFDGQQERHEKASRMAKNLTTLCANLEKEHRSVEDFITKTSSLVAEYSSKITGQMFGDFEENCN